MSYFYTSQNRSPVKIEYYLPESVFTNADLEKLFPKMPSDVVEEKVGVRERHVAGSRETALDLALEASRRVLEGTDRDRIGFILLCTQTPDYFLPTGACILQHRLGLRRSAGALDYNLGCSGFVYGLALAKSLMKTGISRNILLVTADTYTKLIHPDDRANRAIFGDGAAAVLLEPGDEDRIGEFVLGTDGEGFGNLIVTNGGMRNPAEKGTVPTLDENGNFFSPGHLYMNGPEIFNFTISGVPGLVMETLERNNLAMEQVGYFVFHQANRYMLGYLRKKIGIPVEKFHNDLLLTGNTVSSTIPIALKDSIDRGTLRPGDRILLAGFGVGYSWGATVITL